MLRRKTPNGTLSAGYDGTPVEWTARPSANKHILVAAPKPAPRKTFASNIGGSSGVPSFSQRLNHHDRDKWRAGPDTHGVAPQAWGNYASSPMDSSPQLQHWWSGQPPSRDSMLHQAPPAQFYGPYQQVPTVLQPMWPPSYGPTASSAQGPFGPYWPNGAYEPYRPAAVRDLRFNSQFASINLNELPDVRTGHGTGNWLNSPAGAQMRPGSHLLQQPPQQSLPKEDIYPAQSSLDLQQQMNRTTGAQNALPSEELKERWAASMPVHTRSAASQTHDRSLWNIPNVSNIYGAAATISPGIDPERSHLDFRDRARDWAHRVYIHLLASVQHARRNNHEKSQPNERRHSQLAYFPRPPKYYSGMTNVRATETAIKKESGSGLGSQTTAALNVRQNKGINTSSTRNDANDMFMGPSPGPGNGFCDQAHQDCQRFGLPPDSLHRQQMASMFGPPPLQYPFFTQPQVHPAGAEAQAAFEMLRRLVVDSAWQWTDGMLLGGCLAYGLGEHDTARHWYAAVLKCDPDNVEALSNLAATLTMLGNTADAEQYWRRAVKLRPSYFEAVEHLVGLLCQEQKTKKAVDVLQTMEDRLDTHLPITSPAPWEDSGKASTESRDAAQLDAERPMRGLALSAEAQVVSGYSIPACDNGRLIALIHAKGNMLYSLGDNMGASKAFEDAVMVAAGRSSLGIGGLIEHILGVFARNIMADKQDKDAQLAPCETILLLPKMALRTAELTFPDGALPGLREVPEGQSKKAAVSVASNSLLSLAKIYQDGMSSSGSARAAPGVQDILALYYLSLSLQPSPSTANNVGILLAGIQQAVPRVPSMSSQDHEAPNIPGVVPGSGVALALAYYNYGLNLDSRHAHLYTNLGSLLKDIGQLNAAIRMYEQAVSCDGNFDIALANLANAVKDQGRISDAIGYYKRAVTANPDFAEAVCGLANALNSVCSWNGRGGILFSDRKFDRWHVDDQGMLLDANHVLVSTSGWIGRVVAIVEKQLKDGETWGRGILQTREGSDLFPNSHKLTGQEQAIKRSMIAWLDESGPGWEGARVVRLVERATKRLTWQIYQEKYVKKEIPMARMYGRPPLPTSLAVPSAPTVLPFHTFTCPLTAEQIRKISQRNGLRISCSTLRAPWLPTTVFDPPAPPAPHLNVGYVSSDFNNHPLAHLMQSVFGFHNRSKVKAFCYATTASDNSTHRQQIQREAPVFYDASSWSVDRLVKQILDDGIHILINLNGYTRGARNEAFAARPAPIQMSFMGFAGTLGAEWCDYILADTTAVPPSTLRPFRRNVDLVDLTRDKNFDGHDPEWVYGENIIYARDTFFCCDHQQSAPDSQERQLGWAGELERRRRMRKELFPNLSDDAIILGNFNQLYKVKRALAAGVEEALTNSRLSRRHFEPGFASSRLCRPPCSGSFDFPTLVSKASARSL